MKEPSRGNWASTCLKDLKELNIEESLEEIRKMTKMKFSSILKSKIEENALQYLKEKQKSKGIEIVLLDMEMAEYLLPKNSQLTIDGKQRMFSS